MAKRVQVKKAKESLVTNKIKELRYFLWVLFLISLVQIAMILSSYSKSQTNPVGYIAVFIVVLAGFVIARKNGLSLKDTINCPLLLLLAISPFLIAYTILLNATLLEKVLFFIMAFIANYLLYVLFFFIGSLFGRK